MVMQPPPQQHWQSYLIKLKPTPISLSVDPTILWKATIGPLYGGEPDQSAQRRARLARSEQSGCTLHQVARPNKVVTTHIPVAFRFAPRNAHRSDEGALKSFIFVCEQNGAAQPIHRSAVGSIATKIKLRIYHRPLPLLDITLRVLCEWLGYCLVEVFRR